MTTTDGDAAATPATDTVPASGGAARLVAEAMGKSGLLWVDVPGDRAWPAWHVWLDGVAYLVNGPGEQTLPWLPERVALILRSKDTGGRLLRVAARAEVVPPADDRWAPVTAALKASRLNSVGDPLQRWAEEATVTALVPLPDGDGLLEGPGRYDDASGAAPPPPARATTRRWHPWHWRGRPQVRRRRRSRTEPARGD